MSLSWNAIGLIVTGTIMAAVLFGAPQVLELFVLLKVTVFVVMAILALSMAFIWGFGGILCFGQSAFFGLGAYAYAIAVINMGESTVPLLLAIAVPALFAAMLGSGRFNPAWLAEITRTIVAINQTAVIEAGKRGQSWRDAMSEIGRTQMTPLYAERRISPETGERCARYPGR